MIIDSDVFFIVIFLTLIAGLILGSSVYHLKVIVLSSRKDQKSKKGKKSEFDGWF